RMILSRAFISGTKFIGTDVAGINFSLANRIPGTTKANLKDVDFSGALNMNKANLTETDLTGAKFSNTDLEGVDFSGTTLKHIHFLTNTSMRNVDFRKATLGHVNFANVDFSRDILRGFKGAN